MTKSFQKLRPKRMSEIEIRYEVPEESRKEGDLETLINAIGAYQAEAPFFIQQEIKVSEDEKGTALIRFVRSILLKSGVAHEFQGSAEEMKIGVEEHFPEASKDRLAKLFVEDVESGMSESPQS